MRKSKKWLAVLCAAAMVFTTACSRGDENKDTPTNTPTKIEQNNNENQDNKQDNNNQDNNQSSASNDGKQITLTYASWALGTEEENNLERRMIAEYEAAHPNIKIKIAEDIISSDNWNGALTTAAAGGTLPDVALIAALPTAVANEWALDVTEYIKNDPEWNNIPSVLRESGVYNGKQLGLPVAMHLAGYFINMDLFEEQNVEPLSYGYTLEEWEKTIAALSSPANGVTALKNADIVDWYPAVKNSNFGWYTYDGKEVHLNDSSFIDAIKYSLFLNNSGYSFEGLSAEQQANFGVESDWEAWNAGSIAMCYDATYASQSLATERSFTSKFIGLPNNKLVIVPDYQFIGKTTKYPQESYDFAKYMTYGKEGILKRLEIAEANEGVNWVALPLNTDKEIIDKYFANFPIEGVQTAYENMEGNTIVEAFKFTPGYTNARWDALTGIKAGDTENAKIADVITACRKGILNIDDYAEQLNKMANQYISEEAAVIDTVTK